MTNKWKMELILKSGAHAIGYYLGTESEPGDITSKLLTGSPNAVNVIRGEHENEWVSFCVGEIAACLITSEAM